MECVEWECQTVDSLEECGRMGEVEVEEEAGTITTSLGPEMNTQSGNGCVVVG